MSQEIGGDADLDEEALLSSFVAELEKNKPVSLKKLKAKKESEKTKYTSKEVLIDYLNRPASKYGNLNPFDVLDLDFNCTKQAVEQRERQ
ncbi:MAG: DnaJ (Hsp40), subfamily C, member 8, partial [Paramarteilia canceri]